MKLKILTIAVSLAISACSTIKLTDEGEKIRVLDPDEVGTCRELGRTNASVTAQIIVDRPEETISKELRTDRKPSWFIIALTRTDNWKASPP